MEKLRKLTQMTEHPEQYSDEEWQEIFGGETVSDEQVETEWKRFEQQHFPRHNRQWLKMAASFIGITVKPSIYASMALIGSISVTITCAPRPLARIATPLPHQP